MIRILILEDEIPARNKLRRFIEELEGAIEIMGELDSVSGAISFLNHHKPDLIFSDIELLDGNAFDVFNEVPILCPIVFTTAYDQYLLDAFESNGIAYLLKPYSRERFKKAWDKFVRLRKASAEHETWLANLSGMIKDQLAGKSYKRRFVIQNHQSLFFLETTDVAWFEAEEGAVFAFDANGKRYLLTESTLKEIEEQLNPRDFFRINRGQVVSKLHIEKIEKSGKNTLDIKIKGRALYLHTSQNNTPGFRNWLNE